VRVGKKDSLQDHRSKRDSGRSAESSGKGEQTPKERRFVIQKHDASRLHYDFRLEVDGELKSWAVPKGPSLDPREKRLAVRTEDHPLDYAEFEGVIPDGEYGAGTVLVWDIGTYWSLKEKQGKPVSMAEALEKGQATVWLEGKKLKGGYGLTRFRKKGDENWLLVKMNDEHADTRRKPLITQPQSAITGRTIEEIREGQ
jgi:DNA ligase D-like protein (predicted 3'-phosphoesterase)